MKKFTTGNLRKAAEAIISFVLICVILAGCSSGEKIEVPFSSSEYVNMQYEDAIEKLEAAGFTNIETKAKKTTNKEENGMVTQIKIGGSYKFEAGDEKKADSAVSIEYYVQEYAILPFGNDNYKNYTYVEAMEQLEDAGFTNIREQEESTTSIDKDGTIKNIKVNGSTSFTDGSSEKVDTEIILSYYVLEEYKIKLNVEEGGEDGKPVFTVSINLPDKTILTLTLENEAGYSETQTVSVDDGVAVSEKFTDNGSYLTAGSYVLSVEMRMQDQNTGFFTGSTIATRIGEYGECMTGEYVISNENSKYKYIHAEFDYTSTYEEPEPMDMEDLIKEVEASFASGFGDNCEVSYDEYGIMVNVWQDGTGMVALYAILGNSEYKSAWDSMVDSTKSAAANWKLMLMSTGHEDLLFVINILNNQNMDNALLTVVDGKVYYDYVNGVDLLGN